MQEPVKLRVKPRTEKQIHLYQCINKYHHPLVLMDRSLDEKVEQNSQKTPKKKNALQSKERETEIMII